MAREIDWLDRCARRDRVMWWRIGSLLGKAAAKQAVEAGSSILAAERAILIAEAAAYANYKATGDASWTTREELFQLRDAKEAA